MMAEIWKRRRLAIRGLGEHAHYAVPIWRDAPDRGRMVRGTRDNVRALMRERQTILVFPGGAREVNKRRGSSTSSCGASGSASPGSRSSRAIRSCRSRPSAPRRCSTSSSTGHAGLRPVRRVSTRSHGVPDAADRARRRTHPDPPAERLYFWFGEPIDTASATADDTAAARALRDEVRRQSWWASSSCATSATWTRTAGSSARCGAAAHTG